MQEDKPGTGFDCHRKGALKIVALEADIAMQHPIVVRREDGFGRLCCANLLRAGVSLPLDRPILRVS